MAWQTDKSLTPVFIVGPTAAGKSAIALELARRIGGEIISVDSMQVYRGLDIGTAKPSVAERTRVRHHLIDVAALTETFDAAKFVGAARKAVSEIYARGHRPVFCGGTGLYLKAYLEGLGESPPSDPALRSVLEATPVAELLDELERLDPETFEKIDRQNPRRVVRAVEVIRLTGEKFSRQRSAWNGPASGATPGVRIFGFARETAELQARINSRVDTMFAAGLVDETRGLLDLGLEKNPAAMQAIGYRQAVEHLRGERALKETIELVKIKTRQFAKRQMTWFNRQLKVEWVRLAGDSLLPEKIATYIIGLE